MNKTVSLKRKSVNFSNGYHICLGSIFIGSIDYVYVIDKIGEQADTPKWGLKLSLPGYKTGYDAFKTPELALEKAQLVVNSFVKTAFGFED
jgi:hypothetical protein